MWWRCVRAMSKRLLAYSSIAQAGYVLIGVVALQGADDSLAVASVSFYMFMYIFTNLLVFGGVILFISATDTEEISDLAGLNRRSPWLALFITLGLLSLGGIPPAAGFFGKFFLFQAAVNANLVGLALIAVVNAIIALYYYLVVIKVMYVDVGPDDDVPIAIPRAYALVAGYNGAGSHFVGHNCGCADLQLGDFGRERLIIGIVTKGRL